MPQLMIEDPLPWSGGHIVVVDDNAASAHMLVDFLRMIGHSAEVVSGTTVDEIAEAVVAAQPDITFLDIMLGQLDGHAVAHALRERGCNSYLVAVTGWGEPDDAAYSLKIGFDEHFIIAATGDRVPCVYVSGGRVVDLDPADPIEVSYSERIDPSPSGAERPDLLKQRWSHGHNQSIVNGISRIGWMTGGERARWIDEEMADVIASPGVRTSSGRSGSRLPVEQIVRPSCTTARSPFSRTTSSAPGRPWVHA